MANINIVTLCGNSCRETEVKFTSSGKAVAECNLAINEDYKDSNGAKVKKTVFVPVIMFGRTAEIYGDFVKKGDQVMFEGRLNLDSWDDKTTGQKRTKLTVISSRLHLMPNGNRGESSASNKTDGNDTVATPDEEDEIPF